MAAAAGRVSAPVLPRRKATTKSINVEGEREDLFPRITSFLNLVFYLVRYALASLISGRSVSARSQRETSFV
jgi:hypothetical protein